MTGDMEGRIGGDAIDVVWPSVPGFPLHRSGMHLVWHLRLSLYKMLVCLSIMNRSDRCS